MTTTENPTVTPYDEEIPRAVLDARLGRVRDWMAAAEVDALVVYGGPAALGSRTNTAGYVRYLTGWMTSGIPAMLVVPAAGRPRVLTMGPHDTRAFELRAGWFGDVVRAGGVARYPDEVRAAVAGAGTVATVGWSEMAGPLFGAAIAALTGHPVLDAEPAIDELRLRRDPEEVRMHRIGAAISDAMVATAMERSTLPGMTGARLMADVEHAGRERGAGTPTTWLAIGEKPVTTYMEQMEVTAAIGDDDRVQLGTSLTYQGYFAQSLRIGVRGTPSPTLRRYADILIDIQDAALAVMRPGALLHEVSDAIEAAIDRHCPFSLDSDPFRFQSCHGLGLNYSEPGMARDLNARRDRTLDPAGVAMVENMVIEVHPNFTVPEIGHVCAGDMALVTATGAEWLTTFPRGLHQL